MANRTEHRDGAETRLITFVHRWLPWLLVLLFVALAVVTCLNIPLGEGVDEAAHFDYVRFLKEQRALPIQPMSSDEPIQVWMGHHPPLYYALGALLIAPVDTANAHEVIRPNPHFRWQENTDVNGWNVMLHYGQDAFPGSRAVLAFYLVRFMTIGLGAVAVYAMARAAQLLFPDHAGAPLGAVALIAFNPSFTFMASTVHHDTLQAALFSLGLWWSLAYVRRQGADLPAWPAGLLAGAALLTKLSGFALLPVIGLALLLRAWHDRRWQRFVRHSAVVAALTIAVAGWWFVRNWVLYGDPLAWDMWLSVFSHMRRGGGYSWELFIDEFLGQLIRTFWGSFGFMHITFPAITRYLWWLSGLALAGLLIGIIVWRWLRGPAPWRRWAVALTAFVFLFASFVRLSINMVGAGQGRYLLPVGVVIGALIIAGLNGFANWRGHWVISILVAIGMLGYSIWLPVTHVFPKYAPPDPVTASQLERATPTDVIFGQGLRLVGYHTDTDVAVPGQWMVAELFWRAAGEPDQRPDSRVQVHLIGPAGSVIAADERWPLPGRPPAIWDTDQVYRRQFVLKVPDEGVSGELSLAVTALDPQGQPLTAHGADGTPIEGGRAIVGSLISLGAVVETDPASVPQAPQATFGQELRLAGYRLPDEPIEPGHLLPVILYWSVEQHPSADYTVFVHVLDTQGQMVTQFDRPPGGGASPTSGWEPGQTLQDTYPVVLPTDIAPGEYRVRMGLYTWPSLERLPVSAAEGAGEDNTFTLGTIDVAP